MSGPLELELQVISSSLTWVLGVRLVSSARAVCLTAEPSLLPENALFFKGKFSLSQSHTPLAVAFEVL